MASMDRVMELNFRSTDEDEYFQESHDWALPHVFQEPRHTEKIEGSEVPPQGWRMKERMKTVSVALVLCLNVGVDPPGLIKLQPCARTECWVDPLSLSPQKALEQIGQNLQKQYERWQPRARYKQSLDPTVDEVKKLCVSLRRNAKEERVLFHYNGHGVPCPTTNGEVWVFNRNYTQYIPLSVYDLQTWMGYPSIYVYDCNNAGIIIKSFHQFAEQHEREYWSEVKSGVAGGRGSGGVAAASASAASTPTLPNTGGGDDSTSTTPTPSSKDGTPPPPNYASCIQLGACSDSQALPMNPDLPADLFTACLTTPIRMALRWFVLQNQHNGCGTGGGVGGVVAGKGVVVGGNAGTSGGGSSSSNGSGGVFSNNKLLCDGINLETIERVPGQLNDRRTMLGELNWIFTAITDTIAWNILPRSLFQKLFRQDLLVASLFRNFLLAERIMRSYDCTPVSSPKLPPTSHHPMWHAWDYALDQCLTQLKAREGIPVPMPSSLGGAAAASTTTASGTAAASGAADAVPTPIAAPQPFTHTPSPFFEEQLTAFEVWLGLGNEKRHPPEQLPIVLQVLLSQVHRVRALELLGKFLDLGWWAVNLALSVGIFPYVLKLLQSSAKELRPLLVFIWAKILAVDQTCQTDLVRDGSHKYFIQMVNDPSLPQEYRTMAVFVLSNIVRNYPQGQQAALQANSIATCLLALEEEQLQLQAQQANSNSSSEHSTSNSASSSNLHKWICICLGLTWQDFPSARWCGVRDSAHEKIANILSDGNPEVRAAAVFALGCFINGIDRTEHSNSIDHSVVLMILGRLGEVEGSWLVRQEVVVALQNFVLVFENQFVGVVGREVGVQQEAQLHFLKQQLLGSSSNHHNTISGSSALGSLIMSPVNLRRHIASSSSSSNNSNNNSARLRSLIASNATAASAAAAALAAHNNNSNTITGAEAMHYQMQLLGSGSGIGGGGIGGGGSGGSSSNSESMKRAASSSSLSNLMNVFIPPASIGLPHHLPSPSPTSSSSSTPTATNQPGSSSSSTTASIYTRVYNALLSYERDPHPGVAILARTVLDYIRGKAVQKSQLQASSSLNKSFSTLREMESSGESVGRVVVATTPTTPTGGSGTKSVALTPVKNSPGSTSQQQQQPAGTTPPPPPPITPIIATKFINWCWCQFSRPSCGSGSPMIVNIDKTQQPQTVETLPPPTLAATTTSTTSPRQPYLDPQDPSIYTRSWVYNRNASIRRDTFKRTKTFPGKIEEQTLSKNMQDILRIGGGVSCVKFHPYENLVVVGGPGVVEAGSGSGGSLNSSLEVISGGGGGGGGSGIGCGRITIDKSVFAIFEYDDTSHLTSSSTASTPHHHQHHPSHYSSSSSSSQTQQQQQQAPPPHHTSSYQLQPRILNKTDIDHITNNNSFLSYYTAASSPPILNSLEWLNSHDSIVTSTSSLLAAGCNDGCVRVYKPCLEERSSRLVTAWSVLGCSGGGQSGGSRVSHVVMRYEGEFRRLVVGYCRGGGVGGNARGGGIGGGGKGVLGIWDVGGERLVREVQGLWGDVDGNGSGGGGGVIKKDIVSGGNGVNEWVSCLDCNRCEPNVFVIGGEDGSVRLLDFRAPSSESVILTNYSNNSSSSNTGWRDFGSSGSGSSPMMPSPTASTASTSSSSSAILSVRLRHDRTVVAGSANGRVRFFDLRSKTPTKTIDTTLDVTGMDVHGSLPYFGIGTSTSTVNIYGFNGPAAFLSNSIREGFGGFGRIGLANNSITSVCFHEFKPFVSFVDSYSHFSVYKAKK